MLAEQLLRIISGLFVGIYVARYLGPEQFGAISYVLAISALLMGIARMGMDSVLVRELVSEPARHNQLMGTAFWIMNASALGCFVAAVVSIFHFNESDDIKIYTSIVATSSFFTSFLVIDYFFQSKIKSKYSAICKSLTLSGMAALKLYLIFNEAGLLWFVIASVLDHIVLAGFLIVAMYSSQSLAFLRHFSWLEAKDMLSSAWPMMLSTVAILIYMRIDQVMIRNMLGLHEVGVYSAAVKIFDAWFILPYTITISLLPAIAKLRQGDEAHYHKRLMHLFRVIIWLCILAAILVSLISEQLMVVAFGEDYRSSAPVLNVLMCSAVFAAMGSVSARYFIAERMERKIVLRTALSAALNIALNLLLIPVYGIMGAAVATLTCSFFSSYLMDWFDKDLRALLKIKHSAFFGV